MMKDDRTSSGRVGEAIELGSEASPGMGSHRRPQGRATAGPTSLTPPASVGVGVPSFGFQTDRSGRLGGRLRRPVVAGYEAVSAPDAPAITLPVLLAVSETIAVIDVPAIRRPA